MPAIKGKCPLCGAVRGEGLEGRAPTEWTAESRCCQAPLLHREPWLFVTALWLLARRTAEPARLEAEASSARGGEDIINSKARQGGSSGQVRPAGARSSICGGGPPSGGNLPRPAWPLGIELADLCGRLPSPPGKGMDLSNIYPHLSTRADSFPLRAAHHAFKLER